MCAKKSGKKIQRFLFGEACSEMQHQRSNFGAFIFCWRLQVLHHNIKLLFEFYNDYRMCLEFMMMAMEATVLVQIKMFKEYIVLERGSLPKTFEALDNVDWNSIEDKRKLGRQMIIQERILRFFFQF